MVLLWVFKYELNTGTKDELSRWFELCERMGIRYPRVVLAQTLLETGHFKSKICVKCKNLFGMKPSKRNIRECLKHAGYSSYTESLRDYKLWQDARLSKLKVLPKDDEEYIEWLNCVMRIRGETCIPYAEDPFYTRKLRVKLQQIEQLEGG